MLVLNQRLVKKQGLTEDDVRKVMELHEFREGVFNSMEKLDPLKRSDVENLRVWAAIVEETEFKLQDAWKFTRNRNMHSWWYRVPHCTCPKLDNEDNMGLPYRTINASCPIHSETYEVPTLWDKVVWWFENLTKRIYR